MDRKKFLQNSLLAGGGVLSMAPQALGAGVATSWLRMILT